MIRSTAAGELSISPRYRISLSRPTSAIATACFFFGDHQRSLEVMRWGLIPFCAKDEKIGFSTINARAEEVDTKPAFPRAVPAAAVAGAGRKFLRVAENREGQAALR